MRPDFNIQISGPDFEISLDIESKDDMEIINAVLNKIVKTITEAEDEPDFSI